MKRCQLAMSASPRVNDLTWISPKMVGTEMVRLMEEIRRSPVEVGSLSHYLQGFIYPRWCRISAINSMKKVTPYKQFEVHPRKITNVPFSKGPGLKRKPDHLPTTVFHRTCEVSGGGGCFSFGVQTSGEYISTMFGCI